LVYNHELLDPRSLPGYTKIGSKPLVGDEEVGGGKLLTHSQKGVEEVGGYSEWNTYETGALMTLLDSF